MNERLEPQSSRRASGRTSTFVIGWAVLALTVSGCSRFRHRSPDEAVAFSRVTPPVAFEMMRDNPGLPILDLRSRYEFTGPAGHIHGAHNIPIEDLSVSLSALAPLKDRTFLLYCGHDECGVAGLEIFLHAGFEEAVLMEGGLDAWVTDGFGTITGPSPPMSFDEDGETEIAVD